MKKILILIFLLASFISEAQQRFVIGAASSGGGGGSPDVIVPVGTNFKIGVANTLNIKGILAGLYTVVDSATANSVKVGADSASLVTKGTAQVIAGAKNFTGATRALIVTSNDLSLVGLDVDAAPDTLTSIEGGVISKYVIPTISGYTSVDSLIGGEYTPTLTNNPAGYNSNVASSTHVKSYYHKIGNIIFFGGTITATATAGSTNSAVAVSLPFASNLAANDITGGAEWNITVGVNYQDFDAAINTDATNDRVVIGFLSHTSTSLHNISYWGSYKVK